MMRKKRRDMSGRRERGKEGKREREREGERERERERLNITVIQITWMLSKYSTSGLVKLATG